MGLQYTWDQVKLIYKYPHLLGHLMGKDKLTPMHSDWIHYIWTPESGTKTLQGHRGSFKSTALIDVGIPWWLAFHPSDRIALVRKTYTSAADELRTIANLMLQENVKEFFSLIWGVKDWGFTIQRSGKLELSVKESKTKESSIEALGLDSSIVSKHYDFVILDDVSDIKDRQSAAERDKTKLIVSEIRSNIIDRGKPVRLFGTPWHRNDVFEDLPTPVKYPIGVTGLISDEEKAIIMASTPPTQYAINYELTFQNDADNLFSDPHYDAWDFGYKSEVVAHIDAAYGGKDHCALTIMKPVANNRIHAVGFMEKCHIKDWIPFVLEKLKQYRAKKLFMENNTDRGFSLEAITTHPEAVEYGIWPKPYAESMKKEEKIAKYLYEGWNRIAWAPETDPNYMEEIVDWTVEADSFDDCPDSAASILKEAGLVKLKNYRNLYRW